MTLASKYLSQLTTIVILLLPLSPALSASADPKISQSIIIGLIDYPPHMDFKKGVNKSKLYQYITQTFVNKGFKVRFRQFPNKRGKRELQEGNIDLLLPYDDVDKNIKLLTKPLFHTIPGLCFKKEKFIPILSATHRFKTLKIGIPTGIDIVSVLKNSGAKLIPLQGSDITNRGIDLTQRGRIDAFYHPSPLKIYHQNNKRFKEVVCSYFHGFPNQVHIAASSKMSQHKFELLDNAFTQAINTLSYEYYFAK